MILTYFITYNISQIPSHNRFNQYTHIKSSYNRHCNNFHRHVEREPPPPPPVPVLVAIPDAVAVTAAIVVVVVVATTVFCCLDRLLTGPTENASVGGGAIKDVVLVITLPPAPGGRPWQVFDGGAFRTAADRFARCEVLRNVD